MTFSCLLKVGEHVNTGGKHIAARRTKSSSQWMKQPPFIYMEREKEGNIRRRKNEKDQEREENKKNGEDCRRI